MENLEYEVPNILIVDDINANLVALTEMIRSEGYMARPVTSARQAMNAIETGAPHLILLDISMPDIDGFEFCRMLKENANTRDIPIIFISAFNSTEDKIRGFKLGAVDYIAKPFEVEEVILRINTHLKIYSMTQKLELYNKKLYKIINDQIRKVYDEQRAVLYAMAKLSDARDKSKSGHLERTGRNCRLLAMSMQLCSTFKDEITGSFIESIELASPLHDIGEIAISDSILLKTTALTAEEMEIMKTHTVVGADTLQEIYTYSGSNEYIRMAIDIVRYHHENWDGTGYPEGLAGKDIPLSARIVSIIDAYNSLTRERCYHKAYSHEESVCIINCSSGTKYDPGIISVFNRIQGQLKL